MKHDNIRDLNPEAPIKKKLSIAPAISKEVYEDLAEYMNGIEMFAGPERLVCSLIAQSYGIIKQCSKAVNKKDLNGLIFKGKSNAGNEYQQRSIEYQILNNEREFIFRSLEVLKNMRPEMIAGSQATADPIAKVRTKVS